MKKAIIDIGTNSVKLIIGERSHGDAIKIILDVNVITKLGEGMREDGRTRSNYRRCGYIPCEEPGPHS